MWARTLCPLLSSTRNMAFGRASVMVPSSSITPSFFGMSSTICRSVVYRGAPEPDWAGTGWPGNLHRERWWTSCGRSGNLFPGTPPNHSLERVLRLPGSREAPQSRPTLGRHASLVGNGVETRISRVASPGEQPERLLAGGAAVGVGAGVGAGDGVHHHLVDVVRRGELVDPRLRAVGRADHPALS